MAPSYQYSRGSSSAWESAPITHEKKWRQLNSRMKRMFPKSDIVNDWELGDYSEQVTWANTVGAYQQKKRLVEHKLICERWKKGIRPLSIMNGRMVMCDGFSLVLTQHSVWSFNGLRPHGPRWPDSSERAYEGDQRATSKFRRMLPVPRKPGGDNDTVAWSLRPFEPQWPMDRVWQSPHDPEDLYMDYDPVEPETTTHLISTDLQKALDLLEDDVWSRNLAQ